MNITRRHFLKHQAQTAAAQASEFGTMQNLGAYEQQLLQLNNDLARLKQIQSTTNKISLKQELIQQHLAYVDGILAARPKVQDLVVTTILVWCIDIANYSKALEIAAYVLEGNLALPDRFERTPCTFVTEEIANAFLKQLRTEQVVDIQILNQLENLVNNAELPTDVRDMPDEVRAKLYLALGKTNLALITGESEQDAVYAALAKKYLEQALVLDDKCRGRQDLTQATKLVEQLQPAVPTSTDDAAAS
ncbi:phage terminase small subunit [Acinetobacter sp. ANC 5502]